MIYRFDLKPIIGDVLAAELRAAGVPIIGKGPPEVGVSISGDKIEVITSRDVTGEEYAAMLLAIHLHEV